MLCGHDRCGGWGSTLGLSGGFCGSWPHPSLRLDTSFMYMIAGLCMLKLYQKRHPDINASAYSAYACLAIVIFFSVLGVVRPWPTLLTRRTGARVCTHSHPPPPCRRDPCSLPRVPSPPGTAASPASPEGQAGAEGGCFPRRLLTPALGGPHRSSARGTQHSGSSSRSSISLPPCCSAHSSITWAAGSWVRACPGPAGVGASGTWPDRRLWGSALSWRPRKNHRAWNS